MKAAEVVKLIEKQGWYEVRQRGSHRIYKHNNHPEIYRFLTTAKKTSNPALSTAS